MIYWAMNKSRDVVCLLLAQPHELGRHEDLHNRKECYAQVAKIMVNTGWKIIVNIGNIICNY